ncbi:MAG: hypothetical protein H6807_13955 [Planctomycetes bacterium]|nr:hypothetical protein [Planctomycetota bacterium]
MSNGFDARSYLLIVMLSLAMGCTAESEDPPKNETRGVEAHRSAFKDAIGDFDSATDAAKSSLETGKQSLLDFKSAVAEAKNRRPAFAAVHDAWEEVGRKTDDLEARFLQLVQSADSFFESVEEQASTIVSEKLRETTLEQVKSSKSAYLERMKSTKSSIEEISTAKIQVDDTMKALEIRFALEVVDEEIQRVFDEIDGMILSVMSDLEALKIESERIANGEIEK